MGSLGLSNITILIVPGGASPAALYTDLATQLKGSGIDAVVYDNPSSSRLPPEEPASLADDGAFVSSKIEELANAGRDVVLLPHSYGGLVANEAAKGFSKEERANKDLPGGVVLIVYLSCIVADVGETSSDVSWDLDFTFLQPLDPSGQFVHNVTEAAASHVLSDIQPYEKAMTLLQGFHPQSARCFTDKVTYDAFRHIPVSYILCEQDNVLLPWWQERRIEFLKTARADGEVHVVRFNTGHCPNISEPEATAQKVLEAVHRASVLSS